MDVTSRGHDSGTSLARVRMVARGRVQMVGFRAFVLRHAGDLAGTVANRRDGSVECTVEGPRDALEELIMELRKGPSAARVDNVEVHWEAPSGGLPPMRVTA